MGAPLLIFIRELRLQAMPLQNDIDAYADDLTLPTPDEIPDRDARYTAINKAMEGCDALRSFKILTEWSLLFHGPTAFDAFDDIKDDILPAIQRLEDGPAQLTLNPDLVPPDYWTSVDFHGTTGNWDGHDYMGFLHSELIHKQLVAKTFPSHIFQDRHDAARLSPVKNPDRILELGCSSGPFTQALSDTYPDATILACDISRRQLEQAHRVANENGLEWTMFQAKAEDTGQPDDHFDLVASYALFHELPADIAKAVMTESYRVLKPGGGLIMADVKSYSAMKDYDAWTADLWNHQRGYDPFWRAYATTDFGVLARELGFTDVDWRGIGNNNYPYVLTATKPF